MKFVSRLFVHIICSKWPYCQLAFVINSPLYSLIVLSMTSFTKSFIVFCGFIDCSYVLILCDLYIDNIEFEDVTCRDKVKICWNYANSEQWGCYRCVHIEMVCIILTEVIFISLLKLDVYYIIFGFKIILMILIKPTFL